MKNFEHITIRITDKDESNKVVEILTQLGYSNKNVPYWASGYFDGSVIITNGEKRAYAFVREGMSPVPADEYTTQEFIEKYGAKGKSAETQIHAMKAEIAALKARIEKLTADRAQALEALEGMVEGTTVEFAAHNGFYEQRIKASAVYDRLKWGAPNSTN
jgi:hypothetical protein